MRSFDRKNNEIMSVDDIVICTEGGVVGSAIIPSHNSKCKVLDIYIRDSESYDFSIPLHIDVEELETNKIYKNISIMRFKRELDTNIEKYNL